MRANQLFSSALIRLSNSSNEVSPLIFSPLTKKVGVESTFSTSEAYFWSAKLSDAKFANALLGNAILIEADLRGADFRGAQLTGTVLTGANMKDANLDNADLRGALRLSAEQICSARSRTGTLLDDALQTQVNTLCGSGSSK